MTLQAEQLICKNQQQQLQKAQQLYQRSLQVAISNEEVTIIRQQIQQLANELCQSAELQADAYNLLGRTALDEGFFDKAKLYLKKCIEIAPNCADYQYSFGHLLLQQGEVNAAINYFQQAESQAPGQTRALSSMAYCHLSLSQPEKAFAIYRQLIKNQPNDNHIKNKLLESCHLIQADHYNPELAQEINSFFSLQEVDYQLLHSLSSSMLLHYFKQNNTLHLDELNNFKLLISALQKVLFCHRELEVITGIIRKQLLQHCLHDATNFSRWTSLILALAEQSINNEYIWFIDPQEQQALDNLSALIEHEIQQQAKCQDIASILALYAMYHPISNLTSWQQLTLYSLETWPQPYHNLIKRTIFATQNELRVSSEIPKIGKICNKTSKKVQAQYEHHPYPRWLQIGYNTATNYGRALETELQQYRAPDFFNRGTLHVLIAGCGTGQHAIKVAKYFRNTQVTAIDLSKRSLAYAKHMADQFQLSNIEFIQQDILQLDDQAKYHVIECSGVLHHMQDISIGLKKLKKQLLPQGLIKLGLYAKEARKSVKQIRHIIQDQQIKDDDQGIRLLRQALIKQNLPTYKKVLKSHDFYSLSGCRDLLFHVSEITVTPIEIKQILQQQKFDFLGFVRLPNPIKHQYRQQFPEDKTLCQLDNWAVFEKEQPCFEAMYQFYIKASD